MDIREKVLKNLRLTENEVRDIAWEKTFNIAYIDKIRELPNRWQTPIEVIFSIDNKYYSIFYLEGNTDYQENDYPVQKAKQVIKKEVVAYEWIPLKED